MWNTFLNIYIFFPTTVTVLVYLPWTVNYHNIGHKAEWVRYLGHHELKKSYEYIKYIIYTAMNNTSKKHIYDKQKAQSTCTHLVYHING